MAKFIQAARDGDVQEVKRMLNEGACIDQRDLEGKTALYYATSKNHSIIVTLLKEESDRRAMALWTELDLDVKTDKAAQLARLAANNWDSAHARTVVLRECELDDEAVEPVWTWQRAVGLILSRNKLQALPPQLNFPKLMHLDLSFNMLTELPNLELPCLEALNVSHNNLQRLPKSLLLPKLQCLNLAHNRLYNIAGVMPLFRPGCPLQALHLEGNMALTLPPSAIIERGGKAVCQFFMDINRGQRTCWRQSVMVMGQEFAGKTALCRALQGYVCGDYAPTVETSTVGIDTVYWRTAVALRQTESQHVSHARMSAKGVRFQTSATGRKLSWTPMAIGDVQFDGHTLNLRPRSKSNSKFRNLTFRFEQGIKCSREKKRLVIRFPAQCIHLGLRFDNEKFLIAWLVLLTRAASAGNSANYTRIKPPWVQFQSGLFRPATKTDQETWTIECVCAHLLDCAGNMVYYGTHKWHLARRNVVVLVVDLLKAHDQEAKQHVCWFLRNIRERTRNADGLIESRVILVGTHKDKICGFVSPTDEEKANLRRAQHSFISTIATAFTCDPREVVVDGQVFAVSSYNLDGIAVFAAKLNNMLTDPGGVALVGKTFPDRHFELEKVRHQLSRTKPIVTREELRDACTSSPNEYSPIVDSASIRASRMFLGQHDSTLNASLRFLCDSGTATWFEHVAPGYVIIRPQWLHKLFAMIHLQKDKHKCTLDRKSQDYRMLTEQGLLRLDFLRCLWRHDKQQEDPALTLSETDEQMLKSISWDTLVRLLCLFDVVRDFSWIEPSLSIDDQLLQDNPSAPNDPPNAGAPSTLLSPRGNSVVLVPYMLNSVWNRGFDPRWEMWYTSLLPEYRVMAVRLEVHAPHFLSVSVMPEILKAVLPHLDLAAEPILRSDGLIVHVNDRGASDSKKVMLFMRSCEDGFFRVDIAVRWQLHNIACTDISADQLYEMVLALGLPLVAKTFRSKNATIKKLINLEPDDIRTLYHTTDDDLALLMPALEQWKARGIPQHPSEAVSKLLWVFIRAVTNALPQEVLPSCHWLVLSPAMIATQGLPMDDRPDVGWPFDTVNQARRSRMNLTCTRTRQPVDFREYFDASLATRPHSTCATSIPALPSVSASAPASASTASSPTGDCWKWPDFPLPGDGADTADDETRWRWHFISNATGTVSTWTKFSIEASRQLETILSLARKLVTMRLRVERGDKQLSRVWQELDTSDQLVESLSFNGQHGGLMQIAGTAEYGWFELSPVCSGTEPEHPWMWNCKYQAKDPAPKYVQVPQDSPEWKRVQTNLRHSLPGAELKGLKRVQNRHVWERFYRKSMSRHNAGGVHMNMVHPGSAIRELWHASTVTNATCESTIGFDVRRACKASVMKSLNDFFADGGHAYGHGTYFAEQAIHSHWWHTRVWNRGSAAKSEYELILARVLTGKCKELGTECAPKLQAAPTGFDSVGGTESNQQVSPVKFFATRGDPMAKTLLTRGDVFGKQFVVYECCQAYPAYVVTYSLPGDFTPRLTPPRTQMPLRWEHKSNQEKSWTPYSPVHSVQLSQAQLAGENEVILESRGSQWRVDLQKKIQTPVVNRPLQFKWRAVRCIETKGSSP